MKLSKVVEDLVTGNFPVIMIKNVEHTVNQQRMPIYPLGLYSALSFLSGPLEQDLKVRFLTKYDHEVRVDIQLFSDGSWSVYNSVFANYGSESQQMSCTGVMLSSLIIHLAIFTDGKFFLDIEKKL
jgi:hypothetical protein